MLIESASHGVVLGHSERRQLSARPTGAGAEGAGGARGRAAADPVRRRDRGGARAGDTERKLRHQVQEAWRVDDRQLGEVVIAYEPIWAIGTGQVATAEQAQDAIAFVRALVAERSREQAAADPMLYGGSVKPENAAELLALPDVDGALVGGACLEPSPLRRSSPPRADGDWRPVRGLAAPAALIVLDGWGLAPAGPGNAVSLADTPVFDELWARYPAHAADRLRARGRAARGPDGQLRGRASQPRRRAVVLQDLTRIDEAVATARWPTTRCCARRSPAPSGCT